MLGATIEFVYLGLGYTFLIVGISKMIIGVLPSRSKAGKIAGAVDKKTQEY